MARGPTVAALLSVVAIAQSFGGAFAEYRNLGKPDRRGDGPEHGSARGSADAVAPARGLFGLQEFGGAFGGSRVAPQQAGQRTLEEGKAEWPPKNSFATSSGRTCLGRESEDQPCPDLPPCEKCEPVNCKFREWTEWLPYGRCTGLKHRKRSIHQQNNHCGQPCDGPEVETEAFDDPQCAKKTDCVLEEWSEWSSCKDDYDQSTRSRDVKSPATLDGAACNGTMKETIPCGKPVRGIDCEFGEWTGWTKCSKRCGTGYQSNHRNIKTFAAHGGAPCDGKLRIERTCNTDPCGTAVNCEMTEWSEWKGCSGDSPSQRNRFRKIKTPASKGGAGCIDATEETEGCPSKNPPQDCELSDWGDWEECTATCDGGQRSRRRDVVQEPAYGGSCGTETLIITEACGEQPCFPDSDCSLADWGEWEGCVKCGEEVMTRKRLVKSLASQSGQGCIGDLVQVLSCPSKESCQQDCEWNEWDQWSGCTCTCGGGTKRRNRRIKASPKNGGKLCDDKDSSEVAPCNTESCNKCIDGVWAEWEEWSECSASCDVGFKSRHRDIKRHPNDCGKPLVGLQDEYTTCVSCRKVLEAKSRRLLLASQRVIFKVYPNYCVDANNKDIGATPHPNVMTYNGCQELCAEDPSCDAFEYRGPGGAVEPVKCWTTPGLMYGGDDKAAEHGKVTVNSAKVYSDATCNIKTVLPSCPESLPDLHSQCDVDFPCHYDPVVCPGTLAREHTTTAQCINGEWQILQRLIICPEETPYAEFPTVCADANNNRVGMTPHPDVRKHWQCRQICNEAQDCSGYEFAMNAWTDPVTCWTTPGTEGGPAGTAVSGWRTLSEDPAIYARACFVKEVQPECPAFRPIIGDPCSVDTRERACEYGLHTCPDGTTTYLESASCKDGFWLVVSRQIACAQCPDTVPAYGTPCSGRPLCYYDKQQCMNGAMYFTTSAECYLDQWIVLSGGGCEAGITGVGEVGGGGGEGEGGGSGEGEGGGSGEGEGGGSGAGAAGGICPAGSEQVPCVEVRDCELADWSEWSDCSCSCFGVKERHRRLKQFPTLGGAPCRAEAMKEIAQCNPGLDSDSVPEGCGPKPRRPCVFDTWSEWSPCSQLCGGGQKQRERTILSPNSVDGEGCDGKMSEVEPCNMVECPKMCSDCLWGAWGEWSSCTQCGGQRHRKRHILRMPNECGKRCEQQDATEVSNCTSPCIEESFCTWGDWSHATRCSATCGPSTRVKQRTLQITREKPKEPLFAGTPSMSCGGTQTLQEACEDVPPCEKECEPQDCKFSEWGAWTDCSCTQLRERSRVVEQTNACGGKFCDDVLSQTERCSHECEKPEDCQISEWEDWSFCKSFEDQRIRRRHILQVNLNGGKPCNKSLEETMHCSKKDTTPVDCKLSDWREWSDCTVSCGLGTKSRSRRIETQSSRGGKPCKGNLELVAPCMLEACAKQDCEMEDWSDWSDCNLFGQASRNRAVKRQAQGEGNQCSGSLQELRQCSIKVDCKVSEWTPWEKCSRSCGGGQTTRHRAIDMNPKNGGAECPRDMVETKGCNLDPCNRVDCAAEEWSEWTKCSTSCGAGMMQRSRSIKRYAQDGGIGCAGGPDETGGLPLEEWKECPGLEPCTQVDCKWGEWHPWSACTCTCDGGQRTRVRHIDVAPLRGGKPCDPREKEEIAPCNTAPCEKHQFCSDGKWGEWSEWAECSKSCDFGVTWRNRRVAVPANICGNPPKGDSHETRSCNEGIACGTSQNCSWTKWEDWSDCTTECGGLQQRARSIARSARGPHGISCVGPVKESRPCEDAKSCTGPRPQDCEVEDWNQWTGCTATCGASGSRSRTRGIIQPPMHGGAACPQVLAETSRCNTHPCPEKCQPQDGKWGDWGEWGACSKCGGERHRHRHVVQQAECGGKQLTPDASEMVANCTRQCHEKEYCVWADWQSWEGCDATCGHGTRSRTRHLTTAVVPASLIERDEELPASAHPRLPGSEQLASQLGRSRGGARGPAAGGMQGFTLAFAAGGLTCLAGLGIFRLASRRSSGGPRPAGRYEHLNEMEMVPGDGAVPGIPRWQQQ